MPIRTVLVVDDSPTERFYIGSLLEAQGYQVFTAENAEEGIQKCKQIKPNLVIMDVVMPGQSGFHATRKLSRDQDTRDIPVILCTVKNQDSDRFWGLSQGARAYVVKPVKPAELFQAIASLNG